ncbi:8-oxo-dGTP pyrophosphatase MutT (NUDIX family) [Thermocatellispora tengchongensis]|uniref:8-oxo-dGTP pyrophosphatase MutT (NUDIX family) n=1 Tax=Thermocatellispora tengchongensis TaxID=1073253 RepID=A0A840P5N4_9ACTN|nr:NUDIX hydrolase [Thermocatellispora tengchongensis]MBB5134309.1 8-oxo-dGTP pyrophosphatase MutT (NUDIX family) [Thermocatellispora tengchongensis]
MPNDAVMRQGAVTRDGAVTGSGAVTGHGAVTGEGAVMGEGAVTGSGGVIRRLGSEVVYANAWMSVREDEIERPDGSRGIYGVVDKPDFALVIPMEDDGFHLVQEFRYPVGRRTWSFPQGTVADVTDPVAMARTELAEETGLGAGRIEPLGRLDNAHGTLAQRFHVFLATELAPGEPRREHTEQDMVQQWVPRAEFERMVHEGEITDGCSLAAYALLLMRGQGRVAG